MKNPNSNIYDQWYSNNRPKISQGEWKLTHLEVLSKPELQEKRGLNIISYLPPEINEVIDTTLLSQLLPVVGKSGWIIPEEGRHITILDILPHNTDPETLRNSLQNPKYLSVIKNAVQTCIEPVTICLQGIFASPDGITIQGFSQGDGLEKLRGAIREALEEEMLVNMEMSKYLLKTAHVALIKFIDPLNGLELLKKVDTLRETPLGSFDVKELLLNISSQYDKVKTIKVLEKITL